MKTPILITILSATFLFAACGNNSSQDKSVSKDIASQQTTVSVVDSSQGTNLNAVVDGYLSVKNALTSDDGNKAATSAKQIGAALAKVNEAGLSNDQRKVYNDVKDDIKEHAEHIEANPSNIAHQREHFDLLSKDVIDLVNAVGSSKTLFKDYCPMYNNKKGALWLSEAKDIKNPYFGSKMITCGEIKEEIKPKG